MKVGKLPKRMMPPKSPVRTLGLALIVVGLGPTVGADLGLQAAEGKPAATDASILSHGGAGAGVCVVLGRDDADLALELSKDGRFLVHCLHADDSVVRAMREAIQSRGVYGNVSADRAARPREPGMRRSMAGMHGRGRVRLRPPALSLVEGPGRAFTPPTRLRSRSTRPLPGWWTRWPGWTR